MIKLLLSSIFRFSDSSAQLEKWSIVEKRRFPVGTLCFYESVTPWDIQWHLILLSVYAMSIFTGLFTDVSVMLPCIVMLEYGIHIWAKFVLKGLLFLDNYCFIGRKISNTVKTVHLQSLYIYIYILRAETRYIIEVRVICSEQNL